jgi:hypothetical protein
MADAVILRRESIVTLMRGDNRPVVSQVEASVVVVKRDGIPGRKGDQGDQGPPGNGAQVTYVHTQNDAAYIWNISHNLNRYPSATVVDSDGREIMGDLTYLDANLLRLEFDVLLSGKAFLN